MATLHRLSTEYIWFRVTTQDDLQNSEAEVAFMPAQGNDNHPNPGDWKPAELVSLQSQWWVKILVGPGSDVPLSQGTYYPWVRITDMPEIPVRAVGTVTVQ